MNYTKYINGLWQEFRQAINAAYKANAGKSGEASWNTNALRDYATEGWHDDLSKLLKAETANERQHRNGMPQTVRPAISSETASKLLLMRNAADGADRTEMVPASHFLVYRKTAIEAEVIGWIAREHLTAAWRAAVRTMDYAELVARRVA